MISFFVQGIPKGQPRPRAFARKFGDKWTARVYDAGTAEGWKSEIALAAKSHLPASPLAGAITLTLIFYFPRPKSHYKTVAGAPVKRGNAPVCHVTKPDLDNCEKCVEDCLTKLGMWRDDAQIHSKTVVKSYISPGAEPGLEVSIIEYVCAQSSPLSGPGSAGCSDVPKQTETASSSDGK